MNKKGPRMRKAKFSKHVITKDLWKKFILENREYKNMTWQDFTSLWKDLAETIRSETVINPLGVKLGSYTGELKLQFMPHKMKNDDRFTSEYPGEKKYVNLVTRGKIAKIKWERRWAVKFNKMLQFYAFDENREINKLAKQHIDAYPDKIRVARNTLGGYSIWRQLKAK